MSSPEIVTRACHGRAQGRREIMFARTERLMLRPGWTEDAPALAAALGDETIVRNLATAPWPYGLADAEAYLAAPRDPVLPSLLIFERTDDAPRLIGACGLGRRPSGAIELGYWIARAAWGKGFATEAGLALIAIGRTLGFASLEGSHFLDNPASGRVLEKLGFAPIGIIAPRHSCARGGEAPARLMRCELACEQAADSGQALAA
jgi:RimJ/RimL family protein N-acetyltransferase